MSPAAPPDRTGLPIRWVGLQARIEVALEQRGRYRYVRPRVEASGPGWLIWSPNCSRSVDPCGGEIAIAWLVPAAALERHPLDGWWLHARDHHRHRWLPKLHTATLEQALDRLVRDPLKEFWV